MPKIAEIEGTPNPNAMKFILKEPLTWGITRSYDNAAQAKDDPLASQLFDIEHVTNVFYVDHWITVTQDGGADWQELQRKVAEPIRAAPAADEQTAAATAASTASLAELSTADQERLDRINELLDEQIRPYLQGDGGDLYVMGLVRQHAVGALPGRVRQLPELAVGHAGRHRKPRQVDRAGHRSHRGLIRARPGLGGDR